jgi:hypothetical protein
MKTTSAVQHTVITKGLRVDEGILVGLKGPSYGREFVLVGPEVVVGRGSDCDIMLDDLNVSRRHAVIRHRGGRYQIEDQRSKNGVYLNGQRLRVHTLNDGDHLAIGDSVFRFRIGRPNATRSRSISRQASACNHFHIALISRKGWRLPKLAALAAGKSWWQRFFGDGQRSVHGHAHSHRGQRPVSFRRERANARRLLIYGGVGLVIWLVVRAVMMPAGNGHHQRLGAVAPLPTKNAEVPPPVRVIHPVSTSVKPDTAVASAMLTPEAIRAGATMVAPTVANPVADRSLARERYSQALVAANGGDFKKAITLFEEALRADPEHPAAVKKLEAAKRGLRLQIEEYYNSGLREYSKLYFDRAIQEWEKTAALSHGFAPDYFEKANAKIAEARMKLHETR